MCQYVAGHCMFDLVDTGLLTPAVRYGPVVDLVGT